MVHDRTAELQAKLAAVKKRREEVLECIRVAEEKQRMLEDMRKSKRGGAMKGRKRKQGDES